jgi:subtilase family serine protease
LGQLKQGDVYQTQRPHSLSLSGGYQFAADYYTAGDLQGAYNITGFLKAGYDGRGETIAIIDAYGDPEIYQDLNTFDHEFGLPSANLSIIPVGPYEPSFGITYGWDAEVALDVEAAHMMAPQAHINLVVASNDSNGLFYAIRDVVVNHLGNVVSMSWGGPEDLFAQSGFYQQGILNYPYADYYFSLGASEGISFLSSSGDYGAFDGTTSTNEAASFPATSPSVTAVGGTTLFVTPTSGTLSALNSTAEYQGETAWSISPQYVGAQVSSGGGYSALFSRPSYQQGVVNGSVRSVPDVAADANPYTGMVVVLEGELYIEGGTSLSSAMWAGMVADIDQFVGHPLGALNPYLYFIYQDKGIYDEVFHQTASGYNGGFQAGPGYNLVTGLGSPDVPALASALKNRAGGLSITVTTSQSSLGNLPQYTYGDNFTISTTISDAQGATVLTGTFTAEIATTAGPLVFLPLSFNGSRWIANYRVPNGAPPNTWTITVTGSSGTTKGLGFIDVEVGMSMALVYPVPYSPVLIPSSSPIPPNQAFLVGVVASYPNGTAIANATLEARFIQGGKDVFNAFLTSIGGGEYTAEPMLATGMPQGTYTLIVEGTDFGSVFEYVYFGEGVVGAMLTPTDDAVASVSPGQPIIFLAEPSTSESTGGFTSNVTANIYTLDGVLKASVRLQPAPRTIQFGVFSFFYYQQANYTIPADLTSGFYRLEFVSSYESNATTGLQLGSFTTGFYVSGPTVSYRLVSPGVAFEGQYVYVSARITDPAGNPVIAGVFNLDVFPSQLTYASYELSALGYSGVPMQYNKTLGEWSASYQIPSILTAPFYYGNDMASLAGSWTLLIAGESSTAENAITQYSYINVLPYTLLEYNQLNSSTVSGASLVTSNGTSYALANAAATHLIISGLTLNLGEDSIDNLTVVNSRILVTNSELGSLKALNSTVALLDNTRVGSLTLAGSAVTMSNSSYQEVSPALPTTSVTGLSRPISGSASFTVTVAGEGLAADSLAATIDGVDVPLTVTPTPGGLTAIATVNATSMSDGVHILYVTAHQVDGLSASFSSSFGTDAQSTALKGALKALSGTVASLSAQLKNTTTEVRNLTDLAYGIAVVAIASLAVAIYATRRKPTKIQTGAPQP